MSEITINTTLCESHPTREEGRLPVEIACYDLLDQLGISYRRMDHEATASIVACEAVEQYLGVKICKNLFLCNRRKTAFYLLVVEGTKLFHTKDLSKRIGSARLSFASGEDMERDTWELRPALPPFSP